MRAPSPSARHEAAEAQRRQPHAQAVEQLRADVAAAFLAEVGDATLEGGLLTVPERQASRVVAGLDAARAVWAAADYDAAMEVHVVSVLEGDTVNSYELGVVLPRDTVQAGVARAVAKANRAAAS